MELAKLHVTLINSDQTTLCLVTNCFSVFLVVHYVGCTVSDHHPAHPLHYSLTGLLSNRPFSTTP